MKIPEFIKVGAHKITIEKKPTKDISNPGLYDDYYNEIQLRHESDYPEDNQAECFLHEIIESIVAKNNLEIDHTHLTVISESLFQIMRDNKLDFSNQDYCTIVQTME